MNSPCLNDSLVKGCSTEEKRYKTIIILLQITACVVTFLMILFVLPVTASALPPPTDEEIKQYTEDGTLDERNEFAESLGNGDTDQALVQNFKLRTASLFGNSINTQASIFNYCMPSKGNVKVPVFIVDFSDAPYTLGLTNDAIQQQIFGPSGTSLNSFYKISSYNLLNISGDVMGVYRAQYPLSYYKAIESPIEARETLAKEVFTYFEQQGIDFTQYDSNGDNYMDSFYILWSGSTAGWGSNWYTFKATWHDTTFKPDELSLYNYVMYSIDANGGIANNILEHETGHLLGLPDYYSYDFSHQYNSPYGGLGGFDIMDNNRGDHNIFSKYLLGWVIPQTASSGSPNITLTPVATNPSGLIVMPNWDNNAYSEYFIAEYLTLAGNYASSWDFSSPGIRMFHIDARTNSTGTSFLYNNSYTEHKLIRVMEADGLESIEKGNGFNDGDLYRTGQTFSPDTFPNSDGYGGVFTGINMTGFSTGGASASVQVGFTNTQADPVILRTFPADGSDTAEKTSKIQVIYNNSVYKDTGFGEIILTCLSNGTNVNITCTIQNNILSIIPATQLTTESRYLLTIPVGAVRNAMGSHLASTTTIAFSTPMGASVTWGDTKTLPEVAHRLETKALCPLPDGGALITFSGRDSASHSNCGFIKTDQNGDIIWTKVFPQFIDNIVNSTSVEPLQDGGTLVSSQSNVTIFNASMEQVWNTYGKAFVLSNGNIGVFNNTNFTEYTQTGSKVSQKNISTKKLYSAASISTGYFFVGYDSTTPGLYEFIQLDSGLNKIESATTTLLSLPRSESNSFYFPSFQAEDCIRIFRFWDGSNISVIKLGWDMSVINETQVSNTADLGMSPLRSDIKTDGTTFLAYSTRIKSTNARTIAVEKILPDNSIEWRKDVVYSSGNIDCTGFVSSGSTTKIVANTYLPEWCFRTISMAGPKPNCTVTFDSQGGNTVTAQTVEYGALLNAPNPPTKTGYDFTGWYKDKDYLNAWDFSNDTVSDNITLYAKWIIGPCTIKVLSNYSSYGTVTGGGVYHADVAVTIRAIPKEGCRFIRWTEGGLEITTNADYTFTPESNRTFTAQFAKIGTPAALVIGSPTYNSVQLDWDSVDGATGYWVYRATSKYGTFKNIGSVSGTNYAGTVPKSGVRYYYKVRAYCTTSSDIRTYGSQSSYKYITPNWIKPKLCTERQNYHSVKLKWNDVRDADSYIIYRSTSSSGTYNPIGTQTKAPGVTSFEYPVEMPATMIGKTYYYKVRPVDDNDGSPVKGLCSDYAAAKASWTKLNLTAAAYSYHSIRLSWNEVEDADHYIVYRNTKYYGTYTVVPGADKVTSLYFVDDNLTKGKTYYYKVRPIDEAIPDPVGTGTQSGYKYAKADWPKINLTAKTKNYYSVELSWNALALADKYEIERSTYYKSGYEPIHTLTGVATGTVSYTDEDPGLDINKTYYYRIRPYEGTVAGPYCSYKSAKPAWPALGLTAVSGGYDSVILNWNDIDAVDTYQVYYKPSGGTYTAYDVPRDVSYATVTGLTAGTTYYFKIEATDNDKGVTYMYSDYKYAKPIPATPANLNVEKASATSMKITWDAVAGTPRYQVYRATSKYGTYTRVATDWPVTEFQSTGLTVGKTYYFKVRAYIGSVYGSFTAQLGLKLVP